MEEDGTGTSSRYLHNKPWLQSCREPFPRAWVTLCLHLWQKNQCPVHWKKNYSKSRFSRTRGINIMATLLRVYLGPGGTLGEKCSWGLRPYKLRLTWDFKDIWSHLQQGRTASLLRNVILWSAYVLQRHLKWCSGEATNKWCYKQ